MWLKLPWQSWYVINLQISSFFRGWNTSEDLFDLWIIWFDVNTAKCHKWRFLIVFTNQRSQTFLKSTLAKSRLKRIISSQDLFFWMVKNYDYSLFEFNNNDFFSFFLWMIRKNCDLNDCWKNNEKWKWSSSWIRIARWLLLVLNIRPNTGTSM